MTPSSHFHNGHPIPSPPNNKLMGYELTPKQHVYVNCLVPSVGACALYILHFACDFGVAYRHFKEDNPKWGLLTVFFMYLPVLGCFVVTLSSVELWPQYKGCGGSNVRWSVVKVVQHLFFPVWCMWRYAERIFWSVEAVRSNNETDRNDAISKITSPRTIELYFFLQGYLQAAPQILLQLHILMRQVMEMQKQTVDVQVLCVVMSIAKMAVTTAFFQRFKSQKLLGKCYPWFKPYKLAYDSSIDPSTVTLRQQDQPRPLVRRHSSDYYERPVTELLNRETSVIDGPKRVVFRDDPDFSPRRLIKIKGLPEDDMMGKTISFLWWFCFLLSRMLAISAFAYFYPTEILWLLSSHYILVVALLLYDVRADEVRRAKAIFFIFIGFVYLFCLIEFKIKFKKPVFIYNGFFLMMFCENFVMTLVWWHLNVDELVQDWWFRYMFYMILSCSILSVSSMLFYIKILKPEKVVAAVVSQN